MAYFVLGDPRPVADNLDKGRVGFDSEDSGDVVADLADDAVIVPFDYLRVGGTAGDDFCQRMSVRRPARGVGRLKQYPENDPGAWPEPTERSDMASIARPSDLSTRPGEAFELVLRRVGSVGSEQTVAWLGHLLPKLGRFLEIGRSISDVGLVDMADVAAWVNAPLAGGQPPSLATRHNRRSAAEVGFRILRELGLVGHDPTSDLILPPRASGRQTRPLTTGEVGAGRAASVGSLSESRLPAVWALAEATATTHEIPRVRPEDVDIHAGTVWLSGSNKTKPRVAALTDWGIGMLAHRLETVDRPSSLTYQGQGTARSMQASSSMAIAKILGAAGLRADPSVKPESVRGWAGRQVWVETGRIEAAATALGCTSLDTAASVIGWQWAQ